MTKPKIIINFKLYENACGQSALNLAEIVEKISMEENFPVAIAVNPVDIQTVSNGVNIPVFSQHFDPVAFGNFTGSVSPYVLKESGVIGSLINHSEKKLDRNDLKESIQLAKKLKFFCAVCLNDPNEVAEYFGYEPDAFVLEPKELIGGDISVSKAKFNVIKEFNDMMNGKDFYVGAGIKNQEDVQISLSLGAYGVLVSSGVVNAEDPYSVLLDLVSAFKK